MTQKIRGEKYMLQYNVNRLTAENIRLDEILAKTRESLALANDTIRIALNIAGYNVDSMNQFERASAMLDMAQELAALTDKRHATKHFESATNRKPIGNEGEGL